MTVGWGKSNAYEYNSLTPNKISMPAVNNSFCFAQVPQLADVKSQRGFCAGYLYQEKGACAGDSGSGYFVHDSKKWEIIGIVSSALWHGKYGCDVNKFQVFTNVAMFVPWLKKIIDDTNEVSSINIEFECKNVDHSKEVE